MAHGIDGISRRTDQPAMPPTGRVNTPPTAKLEARKTTAQAPSELAASKAAAAKPGIRDSIKITFVFVCSLVGVFFISRLALIHNSIRLDEAQSMWQTSHSVPGLLKVIASDVHVPLYHLILHFWQIAFGQGIETARYLSLLFFMASIPVVYLLARRILSVNWALLVVVLFSFSPFMNWYANEARMYTLLVLVASLSQLFFVKLIESKGKRGWLGYILTAMVGVYSHYFFLFNLLVQGLYFLIARRSFVRRTLLKFIGVALLLGAELTPWLLYFRSLGSANNTSPILPKPSSVDFFNVYSQFAFGFQNDAINTILVSTWPILVVVALLGVKYGQRISRPVGYIVTAAFAPVVVAFLVSHTITPFFLSRYMITCVPPLIILIVWLISHYKKPLYMTVAAIMLVTVAATSLQEYASASTPVKEDFQTAAGYIEDHATPSDIVVLSAPFSVYPFNYYYHGDAKVTTLPIWNRSIPGAIPPFEAGKLGEQVKQLNDGHQYVYLLLSSDQGYQDNIFQYYAGHFENTLKRQLSPDLQLLVYRVGYSVSQPAGEL